MGVCSPGGQEAEGGWKGPGSMGRSGQVLVSREKSLILILSLGASGGEGSSRAQLLRGGCWSCRAGRRILGVLHVCSFRSLGGAPWRQQEGSSSWPQTHRWQPAGFLPALPGLGPLPPPPAPSLMSLLLPRADLPALPQGDLGQAPRWAAHGGCRLAPWGHPAWALRTAHQLWFPLSPPGPTLSHSQAATVCQASG